MVPNYGGNLPFQTGGKTTTSPWAKPATTPQQKQSFTMGALPGPQTMQAPQQQNSWTMGSLPGPSSMAMPMQAPQQQPAPPMQPPQPMPTTFGQNLGTVAPMQMPQQQNGMQSGQMPWSMTQQQFYQDPSYQFRLNQGLGALQQNRAAAGMLNSSGTLRDMIDYAGNMASQEYGNAYNRFSGDRQFGANETQNSYNRFMTDRNFDYGRYLDDRDFGYKGYRDQVGDYTSQMQNRQTGLQGLANLGPDMAKQGVNLATDTSGNLANLYMALAQMQAMAGQGKADANSGFLSSLLGLLGTAGGAYFGGPAGAAAGGAAGNALGGG